MLETFYVLIKCYQWNMNTVIYYSKVLAFNIQIPYVIGNGYSIWWEYVKDMYALPQFLKIV